MVASHNTYQRDAVNVVPLGNHLRTDQQIDLPGVQPHQQAFEIMPSSHCVAVHASNARAEKIEVLAFALRTNPRYGPFVTAIVTFQPLPHMRSRIFTNRLVISERQSAILALQLVSAGSTHDDK